MVLFVTPNPMLGYEVETAVTDIYAATAYNLRGGFMKIIGLKIQPIASLFALLYAAFGAFVWIGYCVTGVNYITLPVGVIAPLLHLNVNLTLPRSSNVLYNIVLLLVSVLTYAFSGWFTAAVAVLCFNAIAKKKGGIDADFIRLQEHRPKDAEGVRVLA